METMSDLMLNFELDLQMNSGISFPLDSDVFILLESDGLSRNTFRVYEIYSLGGALRLEEIQLGSGEQFNSFSNYLPNSVRRQNFRGLSIKCVGFVSVMKGCYVRIMKCAVNDS
jgi:hypothetical protein